MSVALWSSDPWLDDRLAEAGGARSGSVEQTHLRPWATVLRAPTSRGPVWLKACAPGTAFEAGLYEALRRVVPEYGALQRELEPHAGEMLALGVPDMRPARMPERFEEALNAMQGYVERAGARRIAGARMRGLPPPRRHARHRRPLVRGARSHTRAVERRPNDLHPWNILPGDARARFYDWGDSVVAHPFASMLVVLGVTQSLAGDPAMTRLRDAYLEAFGDLARHGELVATLELACSVGKIARALTWHRAIGAGGPDEVEERWITAPIESMVSLLDDSHLGRT